MRLAGLVGIGFVSCACTSVAFAKAKSLRPGLDIYGGQGFGSMAFDKHYCQSNGSEMEVCHSTSENMRAADHSASIYFEKPISSKFYFKVFDLDWGITLPLVYQTLSTDRSKNLGSSYSVDTDGNVIIYEAPVAIDIDLYGIQPSVYVQTGLTIPYLPWIILRAGGGPRLHYGKMRIDKTDDVTFYSIAPGIYAEVLLVPLRLKSFTLSVYAKAVGGGFETRLKVLEGDDYGYKMGSGSVNIGVRLHLN